VGIQLLDQYGYAAARVSSAWNEGTELAVKHTIINNHAVMVAIRVHEHPGWNYVDWQSTGDDVDHAVCIIGWDDNAVVVDYVQGQGWVQRNLGKAWIVKNSHGITHRQPDGTYTNWFYMKIEGDIADEKYFYCIVAPIKIYGEVSFINRLYAANNLDCNNDELSHTNWCGQNISTPTPKGFSYGGGRVVGVTEGMNASLSGFVSTDGEKIAPGEYRVKRYEVNISFRYFGTGLKPYFNYTHGASGNVNIIYPWCDLISINEQKNMLSNATMRTFVYYVDYKVNGQTPIDCYYPCSPEKARVGVIYTPIESVACPNPFAPVSIDNKNSILNGNMFKENKRRQ
jgi:hypothetical protein